MSTEPQKFWAIVELMGHQTIAGELSEFVMGGTSFIRVSVPATSLDPAYDRILSDKAIYAINPVSREIAEHKAETLKTRPIDTWDAKQMFLRFAEQEKLQLNGHNLDEEDEYDEDDDNIYR